MKANRTRLQPIRWLVLVLLASLLLPLAACQPVSEPGSSEQTTLTDPVQTSLDAQRPTVDAAAVFDQYAAFWIKADYAAMYGLLSRQAQEHMDQEAFASRYTRIFESLEADNVRITRLDQARSPILSEGQEWQQIPFHLEMDTFAVSISLDYEAQLVLEETPAGSHWRVDWSEKLIFPGMQPGDKVQARVLKPARGQLFDRQQRGLAVNGDLITIGLEPGRFAPVAEEAIPELAQRLGLDPAIIRTLFETADHPDWFYPLVTLPSDAGDLASELTKIDGVLYQKTAGRIYPAGEAAGLVTGYIGPITAEELEQKAPEGYTAQDVIGKMGLEQVFEARLRGKKGGEITIVDGETGQLKDIVARQEALDGEDITLTLDAGYQIKTYRQLAPDAGAASLIDPQSGAILALVSSPSFDPNVFQTYVPSDLSAAWQENPKNPFINRFKQATAPGSAFKLITAAIGLQSGVLNPDEALAISGTRWQKDASWGDYGVTRVKDPGHPVALRDALLFSDNIYFAQLALAIGGSAFEAGASLFGIGEPLPIAYPFADTQLTNHGFDREILLADTGYGQGEILISPLHLALAYGALATTGNIMMPHLEQSDDQPTVWKQGAIPEAFVPLLVESLTATVENPAGTAYTDPPGAVRMLGKTGTAELKASFEDVDAEENGWFVAVTLDPPRLALAMTVEDVKTRGGSRYVVPLVKQALDDINEQ